MELPENIEELIKNSLKKCEPYLHEDGGGIEFVRIDKEKMIIEVRFLGNCICCPLAIMTLRGGIERVLLKDFPIFNRVELAKSEKFLG
jgi:Fe-S cluster biogenesis protein NfuA